MSLNLNGQNRARFSPIRNLTPERLTQLLDSFEQGYLAEAALAWDTIEKRDDTIKSVAPKRKKAIARHGWEVIVKPNLPPDQQTEAMRHKAALEYFYGNVTCTNALDGNERGGFKLLVRQMMDAIGKRYAVHEIIWKPQLVGRDVPIAPSYSVESRDDTTQKNSLSAFGGPQFAPANVDVGQQNSGGLGKSLGRGEVVSENPFPSDPSAVENPAAFPSSANRHSPFQNPHFVLTAEFRFVPLWFFENTTGTLRFLLHPYAGKGEELKPGAWMITTGEGIMMACSVAWMFKTLPLQDWLDFSQKNGRPGLVASTSAERGSAEWNALESALEDFLNQLTAMTSLGDRIQVLDLKGAASNNNLPYERLIARMDRLITALWRGNDLSTLSREQGYGASLQQGESDILEQDDAEMISETLHTQVDRNVIEYLFGKGVKPLAAVKVLVTPKQSTAQDLAIDQFLIDHGARLAVNDTLARYGRAEANPNEPALARIGRVVSGAPSQVGDGRGDTTANGKFQPESARLGAEILTADFADSADRTEGEKSQRKERGG